MNSSELKKILQAHRKWIASKGTEGKRADLRNAKLHNAHLPGINLSKADLQDASLMWADLEGADLQGANLKWADLRGANLQKVNLKGAKLKEATLNSADIRGADLRNIRGLVGKQFQAAIKDEKTRLPRNFSI